MLLLGTLVTVLALNIWRRFSLTIETERLENSQVSICKSRCSTNLAVLAVEPSLIIDVEWDVEVR